MINIVIFSKDRGCQIDLFLRSMKEFWPEVFDKGSAFSFTQYIPQPIVIWTCSNESFYNGYQKVIQNHPTMNYKHQNQWEFKKLVVESVNPMNPYTVFFVDDLVFKNPFSLTSEEAIAFQRSEDILCLSLRLHPYLTYCYTQNIPMKMPQYLEDKLRIWEWKKEGADFGYSMSVDGHIYRTVDLMNIITNGSYNHPGEFENALLTAVPDRPKMICFEDSKVMNIPINRVGVYQNRHGTVPQDYLNEQYLMGRRLSLKPIRGFKNISCHQEISLEWEP